MKTRTIAIIVLILIIAAWVYYTYFAKKSVLKNAKTGCDAIPEDGYYYFAYFGKNSYLLDDFNSNMCGNPYKGPNGTTLNNMYPALYIGTKNQIMASYERQNFVGTVQQSVFGPKTSPSFTSSNTKNCCINETTCNVVPGDKLKIEILKGSSWLDQKMVTVKQLGILGCKQSFKNGQEIITPIISETTQAIIIDQASIPTGTSFTAYQSSNKYADAETITIGRFKKV